MEIFCRGNSFEIKGKGNGEKVKVITDSSGLKIKNDTSFLIDEPGEYEVKGVIIRAMPYTGNRFFLIKMEEITVCYIGLFDKEVSPSQTEALIGTDIFLTPGWNKEIAKIAKKINPKIIVKPQSPKEDEGFLKQEGIVKDVKKLKIKKPELTKAEGTKMILMKGS